MKNDKLLIMNPVTKEMLGDDYPKFIAFANEHDWEVKEAAQAGKEHVLSTYEKFMKEWPKPIIDSRCPKIVDSIEGKLRECIAPINPILISGAIIEKKIFVKKHKCNLKRCVVVSPCTALAEKFNGHDAMQVVTWKDIKKSLKKWGVNFKEQKLKRSPVASGFFKNLPSVITEPEKIRTKDNMDVLRYEVNKYVTILEVLGCPGGCHNGDGL